MLMSNHNYLYSINTLIIETELGAAQQKPIHKIIDAVIEPISVGMIDIRLKQMKTIIQPIVARYGIGTFNVLTIQG